ncbi:hypothetical protein PaecuDRAFT_4473 [Paenibacillus curdlanolyticus YK9]|uniref:ABC transporter domain-containing protein n=1 Tax=Paenibacillus curdlanolyticus YK9 TaxID=717606 RepID=E0IFL3_9BACL|nr:hypothetical protein [Paenibacillus curdlanolyticus]EFM08679.1 hypothetical protein PaecuDRAFT_4473 [Paenibacillus curdlanolyticus YK9]
MLNEIRTVELQNVSLSCKPRMMNFKSIAEHLRLFSHVFTQGKTYAIIGEQGMGGGALSYLLSGRVRSYRGHIFINNNRCDTMTLQQAGWYVGEGTAENKTIREQLESAPPSVHTTTSQLIDRFELSESRLDREMRYISNERWNASTAIGMAFGKSIYCFPWLDDTVKEIIRARLKHCSAVLKQNNHILIIPAHSTSIIEEFADEIVYLNE